MEIIGTDNKTTGKMVLPKQFSESIRLDLIKRAVEAIQSHNRQQYGSDPEAGKKVSAELSRRRRKYRGSYGHGISRVPRKIMSRRGTRFNWQGAFAPGTVGGRRAHPPKSSKIWAKDINKKERKKAIRSALSAVIIPEFVKQRGHHMPDNYPFILDNKFETLKKTQNIAESLSALGFDKELERAKIKKIRAGKGKARGRKYKTKKSILLVVAKECSLKKAASNLLGIEIVEAKNLNCELLAPGGIPGRITLFTEHAIETIDKEKLFV